MTDKMHVKMLKTCSLELCKILMFSLSCFVARELNIVLIGGTDKDKVALGNFITRRKAFHCPILFSDKQCLHALGEWSGTSLTVVKTSDIFNPPLLSVTQEMTKCRTLLNPGPNVMLLLVNPSDFTDERKDKL